MAVRRLVILIAVLVAFLAPRPAFSAATYLVRKGDTLSRIAKRLGVPAKEIRAANGMRSNDLVAGKRIRIPESPRRKTAGKASGGKSAAAAAGASFLPAEEPLREEPKEADWELPGEAARAESAATDDADGSIRHRIVRLAKKMLSTPYVWGGTSLTGMDCSGFVWKVFSLLNHDLPRSAREQFEVGREVAWDDLSIGDLVFFRTYAEYPSHVGIYLGDNRFIHASSGSRRVKISSMDHPYYMKRYIGAKRLFFPEEEPIE